MVNRPACDNPDSHGYHWRLASNIQEVYMSKRPGSERANKVEECHAKYEREAFSEHLENKKECIYHRLTREVDKMERGLANKYGTRVTLYFKQNNTSNQDMYRFICREARHVPNVLMAGCKSELEYRKWATFYINRVRADLLAMAIEVDSKLGKCLT